MNLDLKGKTVFIGGSSAGIGQAIAFEFAKEDCNIMLCARSEKKLQSIAQQIRDYHKVQIDYIVTDLSKKESICGAIDHTLKRFDKVDILVTNSGGPPSGTFDTVSETQWYQAFENTFMHVVRLISGFAPAMKEQRWGRIINITSVSAKQPIQRLLLSNVFRPAVTGLAKTLSDEFALFKITVNNVAPGYTLTSRMEELFEDRAANANTSVDILKNTLSNNTSLHRFATPDEIAYAVLFLASERAAYITGTTLQVDGGYIKSLF